MSPQWTPNRTIQPGDLAHDGVLMAAASAGDLDAFQEIFHRHVAPIRRYVRSRGCPDSLVDDLVSDTFASAWELRHGFHETARTAQPWLIGIATIIVRRHRANEARWARSIELESQFLSEYYLGSSDSPDAPLLRRVISAIAHLTDSERDVLLLSAVADFDDREIAARLGISHVAARVRLSRARKKVVRYCETARSGDHA